MQTESAAAFYAVAVQILPVLFVVLSVEFDGSGYLPDALTEVDREYEGQHVTAVSVSSRSRRRRVTELALESAYTTYIILALVVGEVVGLVACSASTTT